MNLELHITFKELITDIPKINQQNLFCSIYLSEQPMPFIFIANITLTPPQNEFPINDLVSKKHQKLQLRFYHAKTFLGSISLPIEDLLNLSPVDFLQWLTLFEDLQDDLYDGELGENDEDIPKVLMGFSLRALEKPRKTRSDEKEINPEREKSPASILKNHSNTNSQSKIGEKEEKRLRGVSFAKDVLKKEIIKDNNTSIQDIVMIEEIKEENPTKKMKKKGEKKEEKKGKNINLLNEDELIRVMNEKCNEVLKKEKKKEKIENPIKNPPKNNMMVQSLDFTIEKKLKTEQNEVKSNNKEKIEKSERKEKNEGNEKKEKGKNEKNSKNEKNEILEKQKPEKIEKNERTEKIEKIEKIEKQEKHEKTEKNEKNEKIETNEKFEKQQKLEKSNEKSERRDKLHQNEKFPPKMESPLLKKETKTIEEKNQFNSETDIEKVKLINNPEKVALLETKVSSENSLQEKKKKEKRTTVKEENLIANENSDIIDKTKILELEKEISNWKLEFQEKIKLIENLKDNVKKFQGYESKYDDLLGKYEASIKENEENYQNLLEKKNQIETQFLSFESNQKKSDKTLNESLPQPLEDLKQKNSKLTKNLKEETDKKTQTLSKFNEIIAKYEEISVECRQIQEKSHKRDEEQIENIKNLNRLLIENTQKTIDLEHTIEILSKTNFDLENEKSSFSKQIIKANEHNKLLSKELKEEKIKKLEEIKNLTDQLNEKQLEINQLQNELEILNRDLEILKMQNVKSEEMDLMNELRRKTVEHEETEKKYTGLQEHLQNLSHNGLNDEINEKNQRILDLEKLLQQYQKSEIFDKQYRQLVTSMKEENKDLKDRMSVKEEEMIKINRKQFEIYEDLTISNNKISTQNLLIQKLKAEINKINDPVIQIRKLFPIQNLNYIAMKNDEIDVNVMLFLQDSQIPLKIVRIGEGKYLYGSLKIDVFLEKTKLMVNYNNEISSFDEFNSKHLSFELNYIIQQSFGNKNEEMTKEISVGEIDASQEKIKMKKDTINKLSTPNKSNTLSNKPNAKQKDGANKAEVSTDNSAKKKK